MVNGGVKLKISKHGSGGKKQRYNEVKVTCAICGEVFPRAYLAAAHEKACSKLNTNGDPKPFKCKVCRKGFVKKAAMLQHQEESHKGFGEKEKTSKEKKKPTTATAGSTEGEIIP